MALILNRPWNAPRLAGRSQLRTIMNMASNNVTHVAACMSTLGGLEAVLRHHHAHDSRWEFDSRFVILFESGKDAEDGRVQCLGLNWATSVLDTRRRFGKRFSPRSGELVIYHDLLGVAVLSDLDQAVRRIGFIHCPADAILHCRQQNLHLLDGILSVSRPVIDETKRLFPQLPPERIEFVPVPVSSVPAGSDRPPKEGRPFVIGYSGRLIKAHKRVDRLPELYRLLEKMEVNCRLEILGSGPMRPWLERKLQGRQRVVFHGEKRGPDYWKVLGAWDAIVYVSDLEGMGISLLEAMSVGVVPLYPDISGGAAHYVRHVGPDLLYAPGNLEGLARIVGNLSRSPEGEVEKLRARSREVVARHRGDAYDETFQSFIRRIAQAPRVSQCDFARRPVYFADMLPFAVLTRIYRKGFDRATPAT